MFLSYGDLTVIQSSCKIIKQFMNMYVHIIYFFRSTAIAVLIGKVYPDNGLYCSHSDFLQTVLAEPTAYCTISGMSDMIYCAYVYSAVNVQIIMMKHHNFSISFRS